MKKQIYVFLVQAYKEKMTDGALSEVVNIEVVAKTDKEAVSKARSLIVDLPFKPKFRVADVWVRFI